MIWIAFAGMLLAGVWLVAWPIYRHKGRLTPVMMSAVSAVVVLTSVVYWWTGTPVQPTAEESLESLGASLDDHLEQHPDDVESWRTLGMYYMQLQQYSKAAAAFERVLDGEPAPTVQTLTQLGEALMAEAPGSARAVELFEAALTLEPNNPEALFYGGIAAIESGDPTTAANRWQAVLETSPPADVQEMLKLQIGEWRRMAGASAGNGPRSEISPASTAPVITVNVALGENAAAGVAPDAALYVFARDPAQPSRPVAAVKRSVSELPAQILLSDADAMVPNRLLSAYEEIEIVARISNSGEPTARPGDWYGESTVSVTARSPVNIVIERQVPRQP